MKTTQNKGTSGISKVELPEAMNVLMHASIAAARKNERTTQMNNNNEKLAEQLSRVIGNLDIARDCFDHFLNYKTSPAQLKKFSEDGHRSVQESRKALEAICKKMDARR